MKNSSLPKTLKLSSAIQRAVLYHSGKLTTSSIPFAFRPSEARDVDLISALAPALQQKAVDRALASLRRGEGVFGTLAAGASSRMNPQKAPPEARVLIKELFGEAVKIVSKAALPAGRVDGKTVTFLGAFLFNIATLEKEAGLGDDANNEILILTNDAYAPELSRELKTQKCYGLSPARFLTPHQSLGDQFVAHAQDVQRVKDLSREDRAVALQHADAVRRAIADGRPEAAILPNEKAPLGHADFFHEVLRSGLLLRFLKAGKRWISIRNIDNTAATFDWDWLVSLGLFLERKLDFQAEVSPRVPGQKGGALIIDREGNHRLAEAPSFEATWQAVVHDLEKDGFHMATAAHAEKVAQKILLQGKKIALTSHRSSFGDREAGSYSTNLVLFEKGPEQRWLRRIVPEDTFWFNNATGLTRPEFWIYLYGGQGQTRESFLEELMEATPEQIETLIDRGRAKFPVLIDPKPARTQKAIAAKPEANLWQSTLVSGPGARIGSVGVHSVSTLRPEKYAALSPADRREQLRHLRMLATKQWTGPVESYESNKLYMEDLLRYILKGPLLK